MPWWDARLFATQVSPFVDMSVKGWLWYQGTTHATCAAGCMLALSCYFHAPCIHFSDHVDRSDARFLRMLLLPVILQCNDTQEKTTWDQ